MINIIVIVLLHLILLRKLILDYKMVSKSVIIAYLIIYIPYVNIILLSLVLIANILSYKRKKNFLISSGVKLTIIENIKLFVTGELY